MATAISAKIITTWYFVCIVGPSSPAAWRWCAVTLWPSWQRDKPGPSPLVVIHDEVSTHTKAPTWKACLLPNRCEKSGPFLAVTCVVRHLRVGCKVFLMAKQGFSVPFLAQRWITAWVEGKHLVWNGFLNIYTRFAQNLARVGCAVTPCGDKTQTAWWAKSTAPPAPPSQVCNIFSVLGRKPFFPMRQTHATAPITARANKTRQDNKTGTMEWRKNNVTLTECSKITPSSILISIAANENSIFRVKTHHSKSFQLDKVSMNWVGLWLQSILDSYSRMFAKLGDLSSYGRRSVWLNVLHTRDENGALCGFEWNVNRRSRGREQQYKHTE